MRTCLTVVASTRVQIPSAGEYSCSNNFIERPTCLFPAALCVCFLLLCAAHLSHRCTRSMDLRFQKTGTPTGRPHWPAFVLQSPSDPSSVQDSYEEWCQRWRQGLSSPRTDQHRQPLADAPLSIGDRVRILGEEKKGDMNEGVALVKEVLLLEGLGGKTKYVLKRLQGGEDVTCLRAEVELF